MAPSIDSINMVNSAPSPLPFSLNLEADEEAEWFYKLESVGGPLADPDSLLNLLKSAPNQEAAAYVKGILFGGGTAAFFPLLPRARAHLE